MFYLLKLLFIMGLSINCVLLLLNKYRDNYKNQTKIMLF